MATEIIMPKVDMVMDAGTFVEWLKEEGATVQKGEPLFVVLTDKANIEIEAPASGVLAGLKAKPNDVIPVTQTIGYVLAPGEPLPGETVQDGAAAVAAPASPRVAPAPEPPRAAPGAPGRVRATPAARRVASDLGVDLSALPAGRGPRGRVHKADVLAAAGQRPATPPMTHAATMAGMRLPDARPKQTVPLAGPRKIIAERLAYSASTAPHITLSLRVDMSEATRLRDRVNEHIQQTTPRKASGTVAPRTAYGTTAGQRLSFTAIIARAVAAVLPHHPYLNASLDGERIFLWEEVHLGIAISLEDYLVVPVIRDAHLRNLEQIVTAMGDLLERARARRLTPGEMSGSTFTISNLGMLGIEAFTAIINPPEAAILAVGRIVDTPVGVEGEVVLRPVMNLTLSVDHRIVDGAAGARFLTDLKAMLENPYLLI